MRGILIGIGVAMIGVGVVLYANDSGPGARPSEVEDGQGAQVDPAAAEFDLRASEAAGDARSAGIQRSLVESEAADDGDDGEIDALLEIARLPRSEEMRLTAWLRSLVGRERVEAAIDAPADPGSLEARSERLRAESRWARLEAVASAVSRGDYALHRSADPYPFEAKGDVIWHSYRQFQIEGRQVARSILIGLRFEREPRLEEAMRRLREVEREIATLEKESGDAMGSTWVEAVVGPEPSALPGLPPIRTRRIEGFTVR